MISPTPITTPRQPVDFEHERRLSMQFPPYPSHHSKKDSYDSQTSLSTLADIASSGGGSGENEDELINVIHSIEKALEKFRSLSHIFNDINYDFLTQVEHSLDENIQSNDPEYKEHVKLLFDYTSSNNEAMKSISVIFLKKFISNIPIPALKASIQMTNEIKMILDSWLLYREREVLKSMNSSSSSTTKKQERSRTSSQISTPIVSNTPSFVKGHSRQNSRNRIIRQHHHNRHQSISGPTPSQFTNINKKDREPLEPFNKKRKSSTSTTTKFSSISSSNSSGSSNNANNTNNKNDNISLIVKPPKPVTDSSITQPPPLKGVFNEELSMKSEHKCQQCGSDDTPEWRRGPYGSRSLCNACGLFFGKLIKRCDYEEAAKIMMRRKNQGHGDDRRIPTD